MVLCKKNFKPICTPTSIARAGRRDIATSTKMKVFIRVRPRNDRETISDERNIIEIHNEQLLEFDPKIENEPFFFHGVKQGRRDISKKQNKEVKFCFDKIYGPESTNEDIFTGSILTMFRSLLDGYNCSVFVYGATGAGKTYTMLGSNDTPGIIYLTMKTLYTEISKIENKHFEIGISYLEVYNENVHDLLNPSSGPLHLREDLINGVVVAGMKVHQINDADHLFDLLRQGNSNRTQHPTDANAESSRSHAVFQVYIRIHSGNEKVQLVKLSMIDLAGSERAATTNSCLRFKEGANINKSLLALGNCINNLADGVRHIPYRDSKLTRLLKDSLGGNCQTVMIACVGPTTNSYEDTNNTLKYAARASTIKTKIVKNVVPVDRNINYTRLQDENEQLKIQLEECKKSGINLGSSLVVPWIEKIKTLYTSKKIIHLKILNIESKIKCSNYKIESESNNAVKLIGFDNGSEEMRTILRKIEHSVNCLKGQLSGYRIGYAETWEQKNLINKEIENLREQIIKEGLMDVLCTEFEKEELKIRLEESQEQDNHNIAISKILYSTNEKKDGIIAALLELYKKQRNILLGTKCMTNEMNAEHMRSMKLLKENNSISWETSPNRKDGLAKYSNLSIESLYQNDIPCPMQDSVEGISLVFSEPFTDANAEVVAPEAELATANETFLIAAKTTHKKPKVKVHSPILSGIKRLKENKTTTKRTLLSFRGKPLTPSSKAPKLRPFNVTNTNIK